MLERKITRVFAIISILLLVFFLWQLRKETTPPYLSYQKEYKKLLIQNGVGASEIADFQFGVRQRWIEKLNRVDRCETCHLGIEDPRFDSAPQPFKTHPDPDRHPFEKFGCTVCHGGWPMATSLEKSHGPTKTVYKAIYNENFMENSCSLCHGDFIREEAPALFAGRKMFIDSGCLGCHKVKGMERVKVGPPLKGIGQKVKKDWLYRWLIDPKGTIPNAKMPNFKLTKQEAADIAGFLFSRTRSGQNSNESDGSYERGKNLFNDSGCTSCHPVNGRGGEHALDLGKISSKVHSEWLLRWLKNPKKLLPNTKMPIFGFSDQEIQDLAKFILKDYTDRKISKGSIAEQIEMIEGANASKGKDLILSYGCTGCHDIEGVEDQVEIASELTKISETHPSNIDFGMLVGTEKIRTVPNWLYNRMKNPRSLNNDSKMPDYGFSDSEAEALTTYLLSLTTYEVTDSFKLPMGDPPSDYAPQGAFGNIIEKYQCLSCHKIKGKGADHAPDLTAEGSRVQQGWLERFLKEPFPIRPMAHERMPHFRLSDSEIQSVYSYFRTTLVDNRVEDLSNTEDKKVLDDATVQKGSKLYYEKYACNACHRINSKGGAIGPDLTGVGERLRPEWIAYYLYDPKAFVETSSEPVYNFTEDEVKKLTAFLMSQKEKN